MFNPHPSYCSNANWCLERGYYVAFLKLNLEYKMSSSSSENPPIVILLPVWGESYIKSFFHYGLRSLLVPGNIPSLSREYETTFLFLVRNCDIPFFKSQPLYRELIACCRTEFIEIDDLIFDGNYSATLTIAFERGMRSRGDKMCQTYFIYLVSDYIMADGSLENLKKYIKKGYSGITAGNFLVTEEHISQTLNHIIKTTGTLALNARELLKIAFCHIHPVSMAQTVTQNFTYISHTNRLFWKVNEKILVGRFYLRHMLCIRPEINNYVIGSSCDYSFIPEMCPSGHVAHIQDSDDYCVIEIAPYDCEKKYIQNGKMKIQNLVKQLSEWTTVIHRSNAYIPVIYHTEKLKEFPLKTIEESYQYISGIEKLLSQNQQPIRGHPYWTSCIESIFYNIFKNNDHQKYFYKNTFAGIIGSSVFSSHWTKEKDDRFLLLSTFPGLNIVLSKKQKIKKLLKELLIGFSPRTFLWQLEWFDDFYLKNDFFQNLPRDKNYLFIAFEPASSLIKFLESNYSQSFSYHFYDFFIKRESSGGMYSLFCNKQQIIIYVTDDRFSELGVVLRLCAKYLLPESSITVYFKSRNHFNKNEFRRKVSIFIADLTNTSIIYEQIKVYCSIPKVYFQNLHSGLFNKLFGAGNSYSVRLIGFIGLTFLNLFCMLGNVLCYLGIKLKNKSTSAILKFKTCDQQGKNEFGLQTECTGN